MFLVQLSEDVISRLIKNGGDQVDGKAVRAFLTSMVGETLLNAEATCNVLYFTENWSRDTWLTCLEGIDDARQSTN